MSCNTALLRQAKGFSPYCLVSYAENTAVDNGLLDQNNISFDAPYEEWVYRDRLTDDLYFIPPDYYPPFIDTPYDFDPLYDLPSRPPIMVPGLERDREEYLLWKFKPYARLWNSMRSSIGQIATIAPELSGLWWWNSYEDEASIEYEGAFPWNYFRSPQIKLFKDSTESTCYLFYVNRFCRANNIPFEIVYRSSDLPSGIDYGDRVLDHSRRFIMEGMENPAGTFSFLDTLDAGQARLIQLIDSEEGLDADVRITKPDIWMISPAGNNTAVLRNIAGETVSIIARFYNMGTEGKRNVHATLYDVTCEGFIDTTEYLNFAGLSMQSNSCRRCDSDDAVFLWETDADDIGVHILEVRAATWNGEPDSTDNTVRVVFQIEPRDYATSVLDDAWDMTEANPCSVAWHTYDIWSLIGWTSSFGDSVSGMFEGSMINPSASNAMKLRRGSDSTQWIDTSIYHNLSLAGRADETLDIKLYWIDEHNQEHNIDIGEDLTSDWAEIGPVDLNNISLLWNDEKAKEIWLEFRNNSRAIPVPVRIGWIRLTE